MGKAGDLTQHAPKRTGKSPEAEEATQKAATPDTKRLNANIPEPLHRAVKTHAARTGQSMTDIVEDALRAHLPNSPNE